MKTTYYLVTATAVVAAAVTVYAQLPNLSTPPRPANTVSASPAPEVPRLALPPVTTPPDEPLVMPGVPGVPPVPSVPTLPPVTPVSASEPALSPVPATVAVPPALPALPTFSVPPVAPPLPGPVSADPPTEPLVPPPALPVPTPKIPAEPIAPDVPPLVAPKPVPLPPPLPVPTPKAPVEPLVQPPAPKPLPLPPPAPLPVPPVLQPPVQPVPGNTPQPEAVHVSGKYVVLTDDKVVEGAVSLRGDVVIVRHGALDRPYAKSQVQFVAENKDEIYKFMLAKVPANDVAARLKVARWCMFSGMREQALAEAREVQKLQPTNADAASLVKSLELSLRQFPPENAPKMSAPQVPVVSTELKTAPPVAPVAPEPEPDVAPEAANLFATRVQPFLANQCVECHAKPETGKFKLVRVAPGEAAQQATRANLRAVAAQLRKDEPVASPFLLKTLAAHGGQKLPSILSRNAVAYQGLEAWTALAVGTPIMGAAAAPPMPAPVAPVVPVLPPPAPVIPVVPPPAAVDPVLPPPAPVVDPLPRTPDVALPPLPAPVSEPVLPPVNAAPPVAPPLPALPNPPAPVPAPAPVVPPLTPAPVPVTPVLPAPPMVPLIPPADPLLPMVSPATAPAPKPVVPPIPPAASARTPAPLPPMPVQPAAGTQFGTTLPPMPPVSGPTGGDEFDPAGFNQPRK